MAVDRLIWKILLDIVILGAFGVVLLCLNFLVDPYQRGYFANDQSLRLPYKPNLISTTVLAIVGYIIMIFTIITTEFVRDRRGKSIGEKYISSYVIPGWIWESYVGLGIFTFGAAAQLMTVDAAKLVIGRLRPHFFDVCNPTPIGNVSEFQYISNYTCSPTNASLHREMRLSFPSGHSSFAMYTAIFFILYIQNKSKWRGSKLLRHGIQFAMLMAAWYVGLSRVVDHMHHPSDVAAGFLIGALYAILVFVYVLKPKKYGLPGSWSEGDALPRPAVAR
ncbi:PAP2 superfamily domain-containing protein [Phthorimaea operculella]|nr:PAP2 superfamily domain-containing protein [Phthorimaea operculella]